MIFQCSCLPEIRDNQTRIGDKSECPLNRLSIIVPKIREEGLDSCDCKQNAAENIQVLNSDKVVDCIDGIVSPKDSRVVSVNINDSSNEQSRKPEPDDRRE